MSSTPPRDALAALVQLEERVADLERQTRRLRYDVRDASGVLRVRLGDIDGTGRYGLRVWSSAGALVVDSTST